MINIKRLSLVIAAAAFLAGGTANADASILWWKSKKKKKQQPVAQVQKPAPKKKVNPYTKFMKEVSDSATSGTLGIYRDKKDKIYLEMSRDCIGGRILVGGTTSSTSDPAYIDVGYKYRAPMCFKVEERDSMIVLLETAPGATTKDSLMRVAMSRSFTPKIYARIPRASYNKDSSAVIFEITSIVKAMEPKSNYVSVNKSAESKTTWFDGVKAFPGNVSVVMHNNVEISRPFFLMRIKQGEASVTTTVSVKLLPKDEMRPRIQDSRIGVFSSAGMNNRPIVDLSSAEDGLKGYRIAHRWRLDLSDTSAWIAGKKVTVKNPIVWYVDNTFPESWKEPIKKGVLAWNAAFEKIGLKDVMSVKDFPSKEEDPAFDPDNLDYNCLRYVPNSTANAMGPSWVDPATGEILNASVIVYNDIIRLLNNWRFVQTAQVDEAVRGKKLPQDRFDESMVYVISHEIGHTLGLMHNMAASNAYSVESLRDPEFTAEYGTTPSIMDYARFNYVAQPSDKGVKLTPPSLGVYDEYAIRWLYTPQPASKDMWDEYEAAEKIIDEHDGDPLYRYGEQQISSSSYAQYDPTSRSEDLGDDPIKAGNYGISNLKYILPNIESWIEDDEDYSHRKDLYNQVVNQYYRYIMNVLAEVGGIKLYQVKGSERLPAVPVDKSVQKAAIKWAVSQLKSDSWIDLVSLTSHFGLAVPSSAKIAENVAAEFSSSIPERVILCSSLSKNGGYTIKDYYDDVYSLIFASSGSLSEGEKALQRGFVKTVSKPLISARASGISSPDPLAEEDVEPVDSVLPCFGDGVGESRAPYQTKVNVSSIDEITSYNTLLMNRILSLAKTRRVSGPAADRAHYEWLYRRATAALGE